MSRTHKDKPWRVHKAVPEFSYARACHGDGPQKWVKRVWHKRDRKRAAREMRKDEPQVMVNHRHYGAWTWY